eukprot:g1307.t1
MSTTFDRDVACRYNVRGSCIAVDASGTVAILGTPEGLLGIHLDSPNHIVKYFYDKSKWRKKIVKWCPKKSLETRFASATESACKIWDIRRDKALTVLRGHGRAITDFSWAPRCADADPNTMITAGQDGQLLLWDLRAAQRPSQVVATTSSHPSKIAWHPCRGHMLATANGSNVHIWDKRVISTEVALDRSHLRSRRSNFRSISEFRAERQLPVEGVVWLGQSREEISLLTFGKGSKCVKLWGRKESGGCDHRLHRVFALGKNPLQQILKCPTMGDHFGILSTAQRGDFNVRLWRHTTLRSDMLRDPPSLSSSDSRTTAVAAMSAGSFVLAHSFVGHEDIVTSYAWRSRGNRHQIVSWSKDQHLRLWRVNDAHLRRPTEAKLSRPFDSVDVGGSGDDEAERGVDVDDVDASDESDDEDIETDNNNDGVSEAETGTGDLFVQSNMTSPQLDSIRRGGAVDLIHVLKRGAFMHDSENGSSSDGSSSSSSSSSTHSDEDEDNRVEYENERGNGDTKNVTSRKSRVPTLKSMGSLRDFWDTRSHKMSTSILSEQSENGDEGGGVFESIAEATRHSKKMSSSNRTSPPSMEMPSKMHSRPLPPSGIIAVFGGLDSLLIFNQVAQTLKTSSKRSSVLCTSRHRQFRTYESWLQRPRSRTKSHEPTKSALVVTKRHVVSATRRTSRSGTVDEDDEEARLMKLMIGDDSISDAASLRRLPISHPAHDLSISHFDAYVSSVVKDGPRGSDVTSSSSDDDEDDDDDDEDDTGGAGDSNENEENKNADSGWWNDMFGQQNILPISHPDHSFALPTDKTNGSRSGSSMSSSGISSDEETFLADGRNESVSEGATEEEYDEEDGKYSDNDDYDLRERHERAKRSKKASSELRGERRRRQRRQRRRRVDALLASTEMTAEENAVGDTGVDTVENEDIDGDGNASLPGNDTYDGGSSDADAWSSFADREVHDDEDDDVDDDVDFEEPVGDHDGGEDPAAFDSETNSEAWGTGRIDSEW